MTVISFENRRLHLLKKQEDLEKTVEAQEEKFIENSSSKGNQQQQLVFLQARKIVQLGRFIHLKQAKQKDKENIKLRNGLVLKIHALRKELEEKLKEAQANSDLIDELLNLASDYADLILYDEMSTINLLNQYWEFKNAAYDLCKEHISSDNLIQL